MSFWQVTMKRSVRLSRTYFILGIVMSVYGIILSNIMSIIPRRQTLANPAPIDLTNNFPILSVALLSLSGASLFAACGDAVCIRQEQRGS